MDAAVVDPLAEIAAEFDRAKLDRTVGFVIAADEIRHLAEHRLFCDFFGGEFFRRRHIRHFILMIERALLLDMKRHHHRENRVAVLNRANPAGRVALAVAQPLDLVDDRNLRIAGKDEIAMQRVRQAAFDSAACRHHRLSDHLPAKHPLPARLRAVAAKQVHLNGLKIENRNQVNQAFGHGSAFSSWSFRGEANGSALSRRPMTGSASNPESRDSRFTRRARVPERH